MAPYSSAGAKNEIADDGHFLQKNSFRSIYKKTPSVPRLFWNIYIPGEIYIPPTPTILLPVLTGTRAIELWQRNFRLFSLSEISRYRSARCSRLPTRTFKTGTISRYLGVKSKIFFRKISYIFTFFKKFLGHLDIEISKRNFKTASADGCYQLTDI